jgi:hypothetical protein
MTSVPHYDHRFHAIVVGKTPIFFYFVSDLRTTKPLLPTPQGDFAHKKSCKALSFSDWNLACFRPKLEISKLRVLSPFCFVFASVLVCLQFVARVVLVAVRRSLED